MSQKKYHIGIDIGGTNMRAVLFDGKKIIEDYSLSTPKTDLRHFLIICQALIKPLIEKAETEKIEIQGIGVSIAGVLDEQNETILESPNIELLDGINLKKELEKKLEYPILIDNDTNCFLRGEMILGAGNGLKNVFGIIIGTGIGGAWWNNGDIYRGTHGSAMEPGRMIVSFKTLVELEQAYREVMNNNPMDLASRAFEGDELALKAYKELAHYLGLAFANVANLIDPEAIIIGGGVAESSDLFLADAQKMMRRYIMNSEAKKKIKLLTGELKDNAGAIGAIMMFEK